MNALEIVAITAGAAWLAVLTLAILLLVRQVGILTVWIDRGDHESAAPEGIEIGEAVPPDVERALPELNGSATYLLLLGATCPPCRELAAELGRPNAAGRIVVSVTGDRELAGAFHDLLPVGVDLVLEPSASVVTKGLRVATTPFVVEVMEGAVTGKAVVRGSEHLLSFMRGEDTPGAIRKQQSEPTVEVITHGD